MRSAFVLFVSALVAIACFPEGIESTQGSEKFGGNVNNPFSRLARQTEGETLKRKNLEADRLQALLETAIAKVRLEVENFGKPNAGLGVQSPHFSHNYQPEYSSGLPPQQPYAPPQSVGQYGTPYKY